MLVFNMSHHIGMFPIMIIKPKNGAIFHEEVCQVPNLVKLSFCGAIRPLTICVKLSSDLN